jgi:exopolysaccharide biosynthesis polyprenyl glycosylphosphotransferase
VERPTWQAQYVRRIVLGDAACAAVAGAGGYLVRFGANAQFRPPSLPVVVAVVLPLVWVAAMLVSRSYETRFLWVGSEEFRRIFSAAMLFLAGVGTVSWAFKLEIARGFVVLAIPLATLLTLAQRFGQRVWVLRQRRDGHLQQSTLIAGHLSAVAALHQQIDREAYHGYRVVGCCLPAEQAGIPLATRQGLPVLGNLDEIAEVVERHRLDAVAVLPCPELDGPALRQLGWALEKTSAELLLAPSLVEVAGSRVQIRPVSGLPLLHMERPELRGVRRLTKEAVDRTGATLVLLLLLPALLAIAVAVRTTSRGSVLFRQERVGRNGKPFSMLKFRTMVDRAEDLLDSLREADDGNGVLFKLRSDPRVTPVGKVLRRYSLDELPQLLNVLRGDMSLVGPRPPLAAEVGRYGVAMHRRFLVKPGITGLWQVSGRSDLSWDESVRVDVWYVENWSLTFDLMVLCKTFGAVFRGSGAY